MKTISRRLCQLVIVVLLAAGQSPLAASPNSVRAVSPAVVHSEPATSGQSLQPLGSLLQPDGTLNLQTGFSGSLNPRGWQLVSKPGQPPRFVRASESLATVAHAGPNAPTAPGDEFWDDRFNVLGVTGYVRAIAVSGNEVYVGGEFSAVGGVAANNIAKWNSATGTWSALGSGVTGYPIYRSEVYAIAVGGDGVYVGGLFNYAGGIEANNIARWNSTTNTWSALSSGSSNGVSSWVYTIAISGSDVYVGGLFNGIGGVSSVTAFNIAKWNSATRTWSGLPGGGVGGWVYAIAVSGSDVYIGGRFNGVPPYPSVDGTFNIAKWNRTNDTWSALGSGVTGIVYSIVLSGTEVYVGGDFSDASGVPNTQNIARWNGSNWSALGSGASGEVRAIVVSGSEVYVGGDFSAASGAPNTQHIARWNGSSWSGLGSGVSGEVYGMAVGTDGLYVGGLFTAAGDKVSRSFALWHGTVANPPNPGDMYWDSRFNVLGTNGDVYALAVSGSDVYVGGHFTMAGGVSANYIAKWNGSNWSRLGSGMNNDVSTLAVSGSDVYAGGAFTMAGGVSANYIAKWNGSSWSELGAGTNMDVSVLAVNGSDVYVGGWLTTAGGVGANHIAKWNSTTGAWSAVGNGTNGPVYALAVSGSDVYAGGTFTQICGNSACNSGNATVNSIAKWNGSTWSALDSGIGGQPERWVVALAVSGSDIYVGGFFRTVGVVSATNIAKWNGSAWSALSGGVTDGAVSALAVSGSDVYVGGGFHTMGGVSAYHIARWNGSSWSALGSGTNDPVSALAVSGSDVYVGGSFTMSGGKPSNHIALWHAGAITPPGGSISGRVTSPGGTPLAGVPVQTCLISISSPCLWFGTTDSQGHYTAGGLIDGTYRVTAYPPASSTALPATSGALTISSGASLTGEDVQLSDVRPWPAGTMISPSRAGGGGLPRVNWNTPLQLTTQGCTGGNANYQITQFGATLRSGSMTESAAGRYQASINSLNPNHGYAASRITIQCPNKITMTQTAAITNDFDLYIEPSNVVRTISGTSVMSATVMLYKFDGVAGDFVAVPSGDAAMAPVNRTNPDLTDAEGHFGWDVVAGFYKIRAEKAGCVAPGNPDQPYIESESLVIPPATDLDLRLDCSEKVVFLPLIRR